MWPLLQGAFPPKKVLEDSRPSSTSCKSLFRRSKGDPFRLTPMITKRSVHVSILVDMVLCSRNMVSLCMTLHDTTLTKSRCESSCAHGVTALSISKEMCLHYVPKRCRDKIPPSIEDPSAMIGDNQQEDRIPNRDVWALHESRPHQARRRGLSLEEPSLPIKSRKAQHHQVQAVGLCSAKVRVIPSDTLP